MKKFLLVAVGVAALAGSACSKGPECTQEIAAKKAQDMAAALQEAITKDPSKAADLTAIARRVAEETETPFLVCQDGFLTTHTLENAYLPEDELLRDFVDGHYVIEPRQRRRPESFRPLQDRFGQPATVSTDKKTGDTHE